MAAKSGGCFPGASQVWLKDGRRKAVKDLKPGDIVLAADEAGKLVYSEFLMFTDRDPATRRVFYVIETKAPVRRITLTAAHLIFLLDNSTHEAMTATFASSVRPGQKVLVADGDEGRLTPVVVERIYMEEHQGSYAPVTFHGTIVVDHMLASCYAVIQDHRLAHWAFTPVRLAYSLSSFFVPRSSQPSNTTTPADGIHWYPRLLYRLGTWLLDGGALHPLGMPAQSS